MSKILVVDDDISGFLTKTTLELAGCTSEIHLAEYVEEALQLVEREQLSLVITELHTQGLDDFEFLDVLLDFCENKGVAVPPVAVLTHLEEDLDKLSASRYPMVRAVLSKPLNEQSISIIRDLSAN